MKTVKDRLRGNPHFEVYKELFITRYTRNIRDRLTPDSTIYGVSNTHIMVGLYGEL